MDDRGPRRTFADVILPEDTRKQLYEALTQIDKHRLIFTQWGLGERHPTYAASLTPCATQEVAACGTLTPQCSAMQTVTGPDGDSYRVDSYIVSETPPNGRAVKRVTVMVRKTSTLKTLSQVTSTFDQSTG